MKKESIRKLAWGAFVLVLLTWIVWPDLAEYAFPVMRELAVEQRGQFGDSFGALNALFTGLAFVGVALTFYLQVVDRREREAQRTEEDFEARFFRLNDSLREVVAGMETTHYIDGEPRTESRGKKTRSDSVSFARAPKACLDSGASIPSKRTFTDLFPSVRTVIVSPSWTPTTRPTKTVSRATADVANNPSAINQSQRMPYPWRRFGFSATSKNAAGTVRSALASLRSSTSVTSRSPRSMRLIASRDTSQPPTWHLAASSSCVRSASRRSRATAGPIEFRSVRISGTYLRTRGISCPRA